MSDQIIKGMLRVHQSNSEQVVKTPLGRFPVCMPRVWRGGGPRICERCGRSILNSADPCLDVTPENRWDVKF